MENFKKTISARMKIIGGYAAVMCLIYASGVCGVFKRLLPVNDFGDFFSGFQTGLFLVFAVMSIGLIAKYRSVLKDESKLKAMYIEETDERTRTINEKSGKALFKVMSFTLIGASIISGYFSSIVFFTLLAVIIVLNVIYYSMYKYYSRIL